MPTKRELIILAFYINVEGLTRKLSEERLYDLVIRHNKSHLPNDISEYYHIERVWIPIKKGMDRVELLYPTKFNIEDVDVDDVDKLIEQLQKYKDSHGKEI